VAAERKRSWRRASYAEVGAETIRVILLSPFVEETDVIVEAKWNDKFYAAEVFMQAAVVTEVQRVL
jgi:hypothetical protein